jgi:hypothetical protein
MPCLNEAGTVTAFVRQTAQFIADHDVRVLAVPELSGCLTGAKQPEMPVTQSSQV